MHQNMPDGCQPVPGIGPVNAKLFLVGEALGEQESILEKPFVGRAGQLLTVMLENAGIDRDDDAVIEDVWNMTNGRHLPFVFTTDGTSTAESDYLFARFGQDSFNMTQVAPDVFDVSMKIEEDF